MSVTAYDREDRIDVIEVGIPGPPGPPGPPAQELIVSPDMPAREGPYVWVQTLPDGDLTIWIDDSPQPYAEGQTVFIGTDAPDLTTPFLWAETGSELSLWVNDGTT